MRTTRPPKKPGFSVILSATLKEDELQRQKQLCPKSVANIVPYIAGHRKGE
jgi:hypothetical protein